MKPVHRTGVIVAAGITIAAAVTALLAAFPREGAGGPSASLAPVPPPAGVPAPAQTAPLLSRADASPAAEQSKPIDIADVWLACPVLSEGELDRGLTEECFAALEARFLPMPVSRTILPVSPPLTWNDVFADVGRKIELVEAALADADCYVPDGDIRPHLASRCAARAMAELQVLRSTCYRGSLSSVDPDFSVSRPGFDLESLSPMGWLRVETSGYLSNIDGPARDGVLDGWAEDAPDQQAYAAGAKRVDDVYLRTAWKRAKCPRLGRMLEWMRHYRSDGFERAARMGDSFALAHYWGTRRHVAKLAKSDPPLAHLHLAVLDLLDIRQQWKLEDWVGDHLRLLELAGVDCGDPCTPRKVTVAFRSFGTVRAWCQREKCENLQKMLELEAALMRPEEEKRQSRPARSLPYRKRAEAVAMKYVFAVETLARAAGVEVDERLLRRVADPDDPELLSLGEVEQARSEAAQLVADFQAGLR